MTHKVRTALFLAAALVSAGAANAAIVFDDDFSTLHSPPSTYQPVTGFVTDQATYAVKGGGGANANMDLVASPFQSLCESTYCIDLDGTNPPGDRADDYLYNVAALPLTIGETYKLTVRVSGNNRDQPADSFIFGFLDPVSADFPLSYSTKTLYQTNPGIAEDSPFTNYSFLFTPDTETSTRLFVQNYTNKQTSDQYGNILQRITLETVPVPLPAAAWLLISGLAGLGAVARRRRVEESKAR